MKYVNSYIEYVRIKGMIKDFTFNRYEADEILRAKSGSFSSLLTIISPTPPPGDSDSSHVDVKFHFLDGIFFFFRPFSHVLNLRPLPSFA